MTHSRSAARGLTVSLSIGLLALWGCESPSPARLQAPAPAFSAVPGAAAPAAAPRAGPSGGGAPQTGRTGAAAGAQDPAIPAPAVAQDGKLRIIAFGAHPDDCEIKTGGTAALWARQGHHVKFVSLTNGDIGHWRMAGGPLARRRRAEVEQAARMLGVRTDVLDIHDGELEPTLENRRKVTRLIREWRADVVLAPRPNDYHPDHRYTGVLVQDSAYMVTVPYFCPDVPHLDRNPVFLYYSDLFERPTPFRADVVVAIDGVIEKKLDALGVMESQFFEGGANGSADLVPADDEGKAARHREVRQRFSERFARTANAYRQRLMELYGEAKGREAQYAEAFEVCEYGRQPSREDLTRIFPFFSQE